MCANIIKMTNNKYWFVKVDDKHFDYFDNIKLEPESTQ